MKLIKFDLPINGTKVKNLDELRDNLTDEILALARSGQLERWLGSRQLPEPAQAVADAVKQEQTDKELFLALCEVLEVEVHPDDVKAIFDAPPAPGRFISGAMYGEELKNHLDRKVENEEVPFLNKIVKITLGDVVLFVGEWHEWLEYIPEFSGSISIVKIYVKEGERIKKGDLIFEIINLFEIKKVFSSSNGVVQEIFVKVGEEVGLYKHLMSIAETES